MEKVCSEEVQNEEGGREVHSCAKSAKVASVFLTTGIREEQKRPRLCIRRTCLGFGMHNCK